MSDSTPISSTTGAQIHPSIENSHASQEKQSHTVRSEVPDDSKPQKVIGRTPDGTGKFAS